MTSTVIKNSIAVVALAPLAFIAGCSSPGPVKNLPHISQASLERTIDSPTAAPDVAPIIRVDDRVSVSVAREPTLSLESVRIADDGYFDLPYLGRIRAAGRTTEQIAEDIRRGLAESYLTDPHVAVNVVEYGSHIVTVEGAVSHSGQFTFTKGTTLVGALAAAGGVLRTAKLNQIAVFRITNGERTAAVFNLRELRSGKEKDPLLEPGDKVIVGFSGLQQAWQDFLQAAPTVAIFSRLPL